MSTDRDGPSSEDIGARAHPAPFVRFDGVVLRHDDDGGPAGVSFALAPGSFHILTGAPGAGKTSVLKLICLAQTPARGMIQLFGRDISSLGRRQRTMLRRRIGAVFQPPHFIEHLTVRQNTALIPRIIGRRRADFGPDVEELLAWLGLAKHADSLPAALTESEKQRLAIARAVVNRPDILLVDDPIRELEPAAGLRILRLLSDIHRAGTTVLITSRDVDAAARAGHGVIHLQGGRAIVLDPVASP